MSNDEPKDVFWNPEVGDLIKGVYVDMLENVGRFESTLYKIQDDSKNKIYCIWGKVQLDSIMKSAHIGDIIQLQYVGNQSVAENFQMQRYELEILNDDEE